MTLGGVVAVWRCDVVLGLQSVLWHWVVGRQEAGVGH